MLSTDTSAMPSVTSPPTMARRPGRIRALIARRR